MLIHFPHSWLNFFCVFVFVLGFLTMTSYFIYHVISKLQMQYKYRQCIFSSSDDIIDFDVFGFDILRIYWGILRDILRIVSFFHGYQNFSLEKNIKKCKTNKIDISGSVAINLLLLKSFCPLTYQRYVCRYNALETSTQKTWHCNKYATEYGECFFKPTLMCKVTHFVSFVNKTLWQSYDKK